MPPRLPSTGVASLNMLGAMPTWPRTKWKLEAVERAELRAVIAELGAPPAFAGALHPRTVLLRPSDDPEMLDRRAKLAQRDYVTAIDKHMHKALRSFMPDELWDLLHALDGAHTEMAKARRRSSLEAGRKEYEALATEAVQTWLALRRARELALTMATKRGLRGWDDPDGTRYLNSAPLECDHRMALLAIEKAFLLHAAQRVALWMDARERVDRASSRKQATTRTRRDAVSLLTSAGLGYRAIATLATSPHWQRPRGPPCPTFATATGRAKLETTLKADARRERRGTATTSAAIEV